MSGVDASCHSTAITVYVVYELMPDGDLDKHLSFPAPTAPGLPGLADLDRLTVRAPGLFAHWRSCNRTTRQAKGMTGMAKDYG